MYLTIDPGYNCGWATWDKNWNLIKWGIINSKISKTISRESQIIITLETIAGWEKGTKVYVEQPEFFQSKGGMVTARSGALIKLTLLVGQIQHALKAEAIPVRIWKGNLPKEVVEKRIRKILPDCTAESHSLDAIGLGLYLSGRFE